MTANDEQKYADYLRDLGQILRDYALEAKKAQESEPSPFADGYLSGFNRVVSLMKQQADAFGLPQDVIGLANIDPDADLV